VAVGYPFTAASLSHVTGLSFYTASTSFSLPGLTTIGTGGIAINSTPAGFDIDLPALTTSGGYITLDNQNLNAPNLQSAWGLKFTGPVSVSLPALTSVVNLEVTGSVNSVSMPLLATMTGYLNVYNTTNLTTLSLPSLTTSAGIAIYGLYPSTNAALTNIGFPALTSSGSVFEVFYNPLLPQCQADKIDAQLLAHGWSGSYVTHNNGTGTCP
jgi:hypothetical protein